MKTLSTFVSDLWNDERAEVALEYGLLVAVVALALVVVLQLFGDEVTKFLSRVTESLGEAV